MQGKTYLTAIYCCVRCILYPGSQICIVSRTRKQAAEVIEKIKNILRPNSENLDIEIVDLVSNQTTAHVLFHNSSRIFIATASETARGARANVLVVDEFRLVDKDVIDNVLKKFLGTPRQPGYLNKPEYEHLAGELSEDNVEVYLSSAWYRSHWSYTTMQSYFINLIRDTGYFVCGLPYQLSLKEGLLKRKRIQNEMSEVDFNTLKFQVEMECLWFADDDKGLYNFENISKTRKIKHAFYPKAMTDRLNDKRLKIPPITNNEKRILSVDIALMASTGKRKNDASSIFINQLTRIGNTDRFVNNIIYTENHEGLLQKELALIVRRLYEEFDCTDLVIDAAGIGHGCFEILQEDIVDPETGESYCALNTLNNDALAARCQVPHAKKVVWAINNQTPQFNHDCAIGLREAFMQGKVRLLISEFTAAEEFNEIKGYDLLSDTEKAKYLEPYVHTGLLIHELIKLNHEIKDTGLIKVKKASGERKDRFSSLSYNIWVSKQLEKDMRKPKSIADTARILACGRKGSARKKKRKW